MDNSWTVIKFIEDNTVQAVLTRWILNNDKCFWPPYLQDRLIQSIKRCEHQMDNWPVYEIKIFRNSTYCDYQTARQKEKKAGVESDLNSDIENNNKRRRIQKIYSSGEDKEVDTILKKPPQLIAGKRLSAIRKNTSSATTSFAAVDDVNSINVTPTTSTNKKFTSGFVGIPSSETDATNKAYVDSAIRDSKTSTRAYMDMLARDGETDMRTHYMAYFDNTNAETGKIVEKINSVHYAVERDINGIIANIIPSVVKTMVLELVRENDMLKADLKTKFDSFTPQVVSIQKEILTKIPNSI
ncbi:hypothetical protein FQA39_LY10695 [Lamprigera yunnana]|nr:hypothetical protein FQA39_LY10695 [Lamprigera yunnana]